MIMEIDGRRADLGEALEPVWPREAGEAIAAPDWHSPASLISFPFRKAVVPSAARSGADLYALH